MLVAQNVMHLLSSHCMNMMLDLFEVGFGKIH